VTLVAGSVPPVAAGSAGTPVAQRLALGSVVAIVVTWRRRELLGVLLGALTRQSRPVDHLIVVDNSPDHSVADLVAAFPGASTYVPSWRNLGSAGGFALGALTALAYDASWVWFIDDDGKPATDDCLRELLACAARHGLALVAPVVLNVDDPGRLSFLMRLGLSWIRRPDDLGTREFLPGHACLFNGALFSAEALDVIGVPDYRLFLRGDEIDVHRRALRAGLPFGTCLTAALLHPSGEREFQPILGGRAYVQDPVDPGKRYYTFRNRGYLSTQPGRHLRWPLEWACFGWYFLVVRRDPAGFRNWLRLIRMGRRERLLRRPDQ
jgi:rhamnopyranosyl-N-acetylglucosaminyl-diphospho-decaprenol beta-1,3/1,4-galactofuranosyltransferase